MVGAGMIFEGLENEPDPLGPELRKRALVAASSQPLRVRRKGGCSRDSPGDPVNIPHDIGNRGVATRTDEELRPQVSGLIPPRPQVTEPARLNLSRWRHGFEPRCDYQINALLRYRFRSGLGPAGTPHRITLHRRLGEEGVAVRWLGVVGSLRLPSQPARNSSPTTAANIHFPTCLGGGRLGRPRPDLGPGWLGRSRCRGGGRMGRGVPG
jgi:hypothetical protein